MKVILPVTVLLVAGLQSTWVNAWQVGGVAPDLLLVAAVSSGMNLGLKNGIIVGFVIGFIEGTLHGANPGSYMVSRCLAGALAGYFQTRISHENSIAPVVCVLGLSFYAEAIFFLMAPRFPMIEWARHTAILCALNAVVAPFFHFPLTTMIRRAEEAKGGFERFEI